MRADACKVTCVVLLCFAGAASVRAAAPTERELLPARAFPPQLLQLAPDSRVVLLSDERMEELEQWTHDLADWQDRTSDRSRPRQPFWSYFAGPAGKPDPPLWLQGACDLLAADEQFTQPCELLAIWHEDPAAAMARLIAVRKEVEPKSVWWQHLHVDGLWSTTQSNITSFGLLGAHFTVKVAGRVQVFVVPGIMLVSVPTMYGDRQVWPATDWGVSYRLFNVGRGTVHFNLVHAWILASQANMLNPNMTLAGFSLSMRPHPR